MSSWQVGGAHPTGMLSCCLEDHGGNIYLVLAHQFDGVDVFRCPPGLHDLHQVAWRPRHHVSSPYNKSNNPCNLATTGSCYLAAIHAQRCFESFTLWNLRSEQRRQQKFRVITTLSFKFFFQTLLWTAALSVGPLIGVTSAIFFWRSAWIWLDLDLSPSCASRWRSKIISWCHTNPTYCS